MVSLYGHYPRRLPAIIAILAILLLFIAPPVSQRLTQMHTAAEVAGGHHAQRWTPRADRHPDMVMEGMASAGAHPAQAHHHDHQTASPHPAPADSGMSDDAACGYCELLAHFPLLTVVFSSLFWLRFVSSRVPRLRPLRASPLPSFDGAAHPRAPPAR